MTRVVRLKKGVESCAAVEIERERVKGVMVK
jgi:hypothetical protein